MNKHNKATFESVFKAINKPDLTDEQKQTDLIHMIEMDKEEINDCLQFLGMDKDKWEKMWGKVKTKE